MLLIPSHLCKHDASLCHLEPLSYLLHRQASLQSSGVEFQCWRRQSRIWSHNSVMVSSSGASRGSHFTFATKRQACRWLSTAPASTQAAQATSSACGYTCRRQMPRAAPTISPSLSTPCKEPLMGSWPGRSREPSALLSLTRVLRVSTTWRWWRLNQTFKLSRSPPTNATPKDLAMWPFCTWISWVRECLLKMILCSSAARWHHVLTISFIARG